METTSRRQLLTGLVVFLAAPAIVRAGSLMPISSRNLGRWEWGPWERIDEWWWKRTLLNVPTGLKRYPEFPWQMHQYDTNPVHEYFLQEQWAGGTERTARKIFESRAKFLSPAKKGTLT